MICKGQQSPTGSFLAPLAPLRGEGQGVRGLLLRFATDAMVGIDCRSWEIVALSRHNLRVHPHTPPPPLPETGRGGEETWLGPLPETGRGGGVTFVAAGRNRRGQSLVEFAIVALVLYMLLAAILTFGHMLYVAQGLQGAADLAAREISRTPLPALTTFETVLSDGSLDVIYSEDYLVFDLDTLGAGQSFFQNVVSGWPILNKQLATLMIVDRPDFDGDGTPDRNFIRYPGALLVDATKPSGYTVGIPLVTARASDGIETIRWIKVIEEIEPTDPTDDKYDPFSVANTVTRGIVALRINYPFQSASMSSFRPNAAGPFEPTIGQPNAADDGAVTQLNAAPGGLTGAPLSDGELYAGTYGGQFGLGAQGAMGSQEHTGGRPVRPYRRVISAQAIYRREVFE